jgi:lipopolysaccharide/colanic/teichoic acid biosynthesis glycosyltransferase
MATQTTLMQTIRIDAGYSRIKRALDIAFTLLISPLLLLVGVVIAVCIKLDSEGPIFYRQKRIGQHGVEFEMLKFRSMYVNCDDQLHRASIEKFMNGHKLNDDQAGDTAYKVVHDPRITRVGRIIRKTSIDELPQFWNVLLGQMTLVGPRPPLSYEVELYTPHDWLRLAGKPGLTGLWQVHGRSRVTFENMVDMDIVYLQQQSLWQDVKLIFLTIPVILLGRGGA